MTNEEIIRVANFALFKVGEEPFDKDEAREFLEFYFNQRYMKENE